MAGVDVEINEQRVFSGRLKTRYRSSIHAKGRCREVVSDTIKRNRCGTSERRVNRADVLSPRECGVAGIASRSCLVL